MNDVIVMKDRSAKTDDRGGFRRVLRAAAAVLAVGAIAACGAVETSDATGAAEDGNVAESADAFTVNCGLGCGVGYHPESFYCVNCPGNSNNNCAGGDRNSAVCEPNVGTFNSCEAGCPSGWHVEAEWHTDGCCRDANCPTYNTKRCVPDSASFYTCGIYCPWGSIDGDVFYSPDCAPSWRPYNARWCAR